MAASGLMLKDAEVRVLSTMATHARCVGADETDPEHGYVRLTVGWALAKRGLCDEEISAMGQPVFVLTAEGARALTEVDA